MPKKPPLKNVGEFEIVSKVIPGRPIRENKDGVEYTVTFFNRNKKGFEYTVNGKTVDRTTFEEKYK